MELAFRKVVKQDLKESEEVGLALLEILFEANAKT